MPLPVLSILEMRDWEAKTWASGQTERAVISKAGEALAKSILSKTAPDSRILVLAGKGNNGADALASVSHLAPRAIDVLRIANAAESMPALQISLAHQPALIVDGLFGIGLNRTLDASWISIFEKVNTSGIPILSVDIPSGLHGDTGQKFGAAIRAKWTLTMGAPKRGLLQPGTSEYVGRIEVADDIGLSTQTFQAELQWSMESDFDDIRQFQRPLDSNKGTYGHVCATAGSLGFHGAAVLASHAALRAQPGLVSLIVPETIYVPVAGQSKAVMVHPWRANLSIPKTTSILAGPGMAGADIDESMKESIRTDWREAKFPMVADASALAWLPQGTVAGPRVMTPHPGEAARLLGCSIESVQKDRPASLRRLSSLFGNCFVVLKGHQTAIGMGNGPIVINGTGNPYLAQGGSGDILAGFLAGLLAQAQWQKDIGHTIAYAVWRHGEAADGLQQSGRHWTVEDLVQAL